MDYLAKLQEALDVLYNELSSKIMTYIISDEKPVLELTFVNGLSLYIRYNDFDEYSYQLNFSSKKFDRIRYDNYDKHWDVSTSPHHLHKRGSKIAIESPMTGNPKEDMKKLLELIEIYIL